MWKFCQKVQFPHSCQRIAHPHNFNTRKLGEITVFFAVYLTHRQLTHIETAKGLNFSITSKTLPNKYIIGNKEDAVKDLEKKEADTICAKLSLTI